MLQHFWVPWNILPPPPHSKITICSALEKSHLVKTEPQAGGWWQPNKPPNCSWRAQGAAGRTHQWDIDCLKAGSKLNRKFVLLLVLVLEHMMRTSPSTRLKNKNPQTNPPQVFLYKEGFPEDDSNITFNKILTPSPKWAFSAANYPKIKAFVK